MGFLLKLGIGVLGAGGIVWGVKEMRLAGAAAEVPTRMTCKELGEKGAAGNAHVILTDFLLTADLVYEHSKKASAKDTWKKVWIPAVPLDSEYAKALAQAGASGAAKIPLPRPVSVIVVSTATKNQEELGALGDKTELDGMVVNVVESIKGEEKRLLEESYGDVSKAQLFEVGRTPTGAVASLAAIVAGAAVIVGVILSFVRRKG